MPTVTVTETLFAAIDDVWRVVCNVREYPAIMPHVRDVQVLEEGENWAVTSWEVELKGSILKWVEIERRDPQRHRITYEQRDGDLAVFQGFWQFEPLANGTTKAELHVTFEIGIPMLREMLDPVAVRAIRENSVKMLRSLGVERGDLSDTRPL